MLNGNNSKKSWRIVVADTAKKQLRRIPVKDTERIENVIDTMIGGSFRGDIIRLGGEENRWRRRVGNYRILYNILSEERMIFVYDVRRRTSNTY